MQDLKTLKLASLLLTAERLEQFIVYERTLLAAVKGSDKAEWAGRYAFGHAAALKASNLDLVDQQRLRVQVQDFCGRLSAANTVRTRLATLEGKPGTDPAALTKLKAELAELEAMHEFGDRYGAEALQLLNGRSVELLALHETLVKAEGTGHLHNVAREPLPS